MSSRTRAPAGPDDSTRTGKPCHRARVAREDGHPADLVVAVLDDRRTQPVGEQLLQHRSSLAL